MPLNPNLEIFRSVPSRFQSPFASNDSQLSPKYQAVAKAAADAKNLVSMGERLLCQQQAQAWRDGLALVNYAKATVVADILADSLPQVAWLSKEGPAGLFAWLICALGQHTRRNSQRGRDSLLDRVRRHHHASEGLWKTG